MSQKDKQVVMELKLARVNLRMNRPLILKIDWVRGKAYFFLIVVLNNSGTKRVESRLITAEPSSYDQQTEILIKEEFQITTFIYYLDKQGRYEPKPVSINLIKISFSLS
jgi:hypothetical protein